MTYSPDNPPPSKQNAPANQPANAAAYATLRTTADYAAWKRAAGVRLAQVVEEERRKEAAKLAAAGNETFSELAP